MPLLPFLALLAVQPRLEVKIFLLSDCPISRQYAPEIGRLAKQYAGKVEFRMVFVDAHLTAKEAEKHLSEFHLPSHFSLDPKAEEARSYGIMRVPSAVIRFTPPPPRAGQPAPRPNVPYIGRIDDRFVSLGKSRVKPNERNLKDALDSVLAGRPVAKPRTEAVGCLLPG